MGARAVNFKLDVLIDQSGPPYQIEDVSTSILWKYDFASATAASALVNESAVMVGGGIEATKVIDMFEVDENSEQDGQDSMARKDVLLTRQQSRGVVAQCSSRLKAQGLTAAVVGSPGIGKSWLILYALQQALLYEDATVILQVSSANSRFLFVRRKNTIYSWHQECDGLQQMSSSLFHQRATLVLYDAPEVQKSGKGGAKYAEGKRSLLAFLSANDGHSVKKSEKRSPDVKHYLAHPSTEELNLMMPFLTNNKVDAALLKERTQQVGNLLRYLLSEKAYTERTRKLEHAIRKIDADDEYFLQSIQSGGEALLSDTLPGTLFTVGARRRRHLSPEVIAIDDNNNDNDNDTDNLDDEEMTMDERHKDSAATSGVAGASADKKREENAVASSADNLNDEETTMDDKHEDAIALFDADDNETVYQPEDYDGGHYDYTNRVVSVLTTIVLEKILSAHRKIILSYWGVIDSAQFADMGGAVERLFIADLQRGNCAFRRHKLGDKTGNDDVLQLDSPPELIDLQLRTQDEAFHQLGEIFSSSNTNAIVLFKTGFILIDCAGPGRRVYQVTVGDDHSMSLDGMQKLLTAAGFTTNLGTDGLATECPDGPPLHQGCWNSTGLSHRHVFLTGPRRAQKSIPQPSEARRRRRKFGRQRQKRFSINA